jgi:23S rRNA pseudouridine2605 synthase
MRLQKLLAAGGYGSRRTIEEWIRAGRVTVAGRTAQLGDQAAAEDDVRLDGRKLALAPAAAATAVLLYNKPAGRVTTRRDPQGRPTVFEQLPSPPHGRWISVGRLDVNTTGLLLFTTDGALAHRLMHPSAEVEREYLVRVHGPVGAEVLAQLRRGVLLEDGPARFEQLAAVRTEGTHHWYRVTLREGRNREVRRLWAQVGCEVSRLSRIRYGPITLPQGLRAGAWLRASPEEIERLAGVARPGPSPSRRPAVPGPDA